MGRRITIVGHPPIDLRDLYHGVLDASWPVLLAGIVVAYIGANLIFAALYLTTGDGIENADPGSFRDAFFFSVQTMATIGYGKMVPRGTAANLLVTLEAMIGLFGFAMATSLMFAKFARPSSRVIFSRHPVIVPRDGVRSLVFRMANERFNRIAEAEVRLVFARDEITPEGERLYRFYDLPLVRSRSSIFALTFTVVHRIDASSPLFDATPASLAAGNVTIIATMTGLDETFATTIHARHAWNAQDLRWDHRMVDVLRTFPDGSRELDYERFHDVEPFVGAGDAGGDAAA